MVLKLVVIVLVTEKVDVNGYVSPVSLGGAESKHFEVQRSTPQSSCLVSFLLSLPPSLLSSPSLIYIEIDLP